MVKPREKLLLFDVDGVIIDSFAIIYQDLMTVFVEHGVKPISQEQYRDLFKGNALQAVLAKLGETSLNKVNLANIVLSYDKTKLFAGMKEVLQKLAKQHLLVVVTSTLIEPLYAKFEQAGIAELFSAYLGPQAGVFKDKKIELALAENGKSAAETYFITDTVGDLIEAQKTGVKTVAVTWGYQDQSILQKSKPDAIVNTPDQLLTLLL